MSGIALCLAVLLDALLGEPRRFHPLVGFGYCAHKIQKRFNTRPSSRYSIIVGGFSCVVLIVVPLVVSIGATLYLPPALNIVFASVVLYFCIGHKSLADHAYAVLRPLHRGDLVVAREYVGRIVSRDTQNMDALAIRRAAIESVLENGSDAVFAPIFWFLILGAPGVIAYRLVNTLDAMWGYKTQNFRYFGRVAARLDDIINWVPSRLVSFSYILLRNKNTGWHAWRSQAHMCESPNAGPVMASGAGALAIELGGEAEYDGAIKQRPRLGVGRPPEDNDIIRAIALVRHTLVLWCFAAAAMSLVIAKI